MKPFPMRAGFYKFMSLSGAAAALFPSEALAGKPKDKPDIIIIVADDLGWGDVGYHGSVIPTPNIDSFVRNGLELDRFYTAPISSPTRCGLMTGRYPDRFGIRETVIPPWRDYGLDPKERTIADVLGENGYANRAIVGKWHLGHAREEYYPLNRGFTHFYGCLNGALDYFTHEREGELDWHNDKESCYDKGYTTDLIAAEAARCISEYSKDGPYFLYVCFNAPHAPYEAPEDEIESLISKEEFDSLPEKDKKGWTYRAMVSRMDKGIGVILDALEKSGKKDNTLVLFMSDNGGVPGMEPYCVNSPHRGSKFEEWEGGVRNAAAVSWPAGIKAKGAKTEQVIAYVDILPTLAAIVGVKTAPERPYDGIDVSQLLRNPKKKIDRDLYLGMGAAVNNRYKLILAGGNERLGLKEDFFTDIVKNPSENPDDVSSYPEKQVLRLRRVVSEGDAIVPVQKELPFGAGKKGFKAPKEWNVFKKQRHHEGVVFEAFRRSRSTFHSGISC